MVEYIGGANRPNSPTWAFYSNDSVQHFVNLGVLFVPIAQPVETCPAVQYFVNLWGATGLGRMPIEYFLKEPDAQADLAALDFPFHSDEMRGG